MKPILILIAAALLAGCQTPHREPLARIIEAPPERVRTAGVTHLAETGWTPVSGDALVLTFQKDMPFGAQIFLQEIGGQPARHQFTLSVLPYGTNETRLLGYLAMVTTRFGNPQRHENREQDQRVLWMLDCIRARTIGEAMPPEPKSTNAPARSPKSARN